MKKTLDFIYLLAAFLVCLPLASCGSSSSKNKLAGKWEYSFAHSEGGVSVGLSGTFTFSKDGAYKHDFAMPLQQENDGVVVNMAVNGYQSGEWDVVGNELHVTVKSCDVKVTKASAYNELLGSYDVTGSELKELEDIYLSDVKSSLLVDEVDEITSLTPTTLVLASNGETITCTKVQ